MAYINSGVVLPSIISSIKSLLPIHNEFMKQRWPVKLPHKHMIYTTLYAPQCERRILVASENLLLDISKKIISSAYGKFGNRKILSVGFMESAVASQSTQGWHYDYHGKTENIFVPMCDLTNKNGTPFVEFPSPAIQMKFFEENFKRINIAQSFQLPANLPKPFEVRRMTSRPFEINRMLNVALHSGANNEENFRRFIFYICSTHLPGFDLEKRYLAPCLEGGEDVPGDEICVAPDFDDFRK